MAFERIQDAVAQLQDFIEMPRQADVAASILAPRSKGATASADYTKTIMDLLLNVSRGSKSARAMDAALLRLTQGNNPTPRSDIEKLIKVFVDGGTFDRTRKMSTIVGPGSSRLSATLVDTVRITPAGRLVDATVMFLNMIPTLEMSRAVPYLTIEVQTKRPPVSTDGKAQGMSQVRFLQGALDVSNSSINKNILLALQTDVDGNVTPGITNSGMELFTSPQTLVDPSPSIDGRRSTPVLDKFRPFMSIEKFTVDVQGQVGFFSYRTATLELTLHDRSRLNEIADFVRPDLYGTTELMVEYGWSHPDASGQNVYALLLNALRMREKYGIVNASFSFTKAGEVKVKLKLFTRGFSDTQTVTIGDGVEEVRTAREALQELQRVITEVRIKVLQEDTTKSAKEIRGEQQLFAQGEDLGASLELSPDAAASVRKFLQKNDGDLTGDLQTLHDDLLELYGKDGRGGKRIKALKAKVSENVRKKLASIKNPPKDSDPFLTTASSTLAAVARDARLNDIKLATRGYVSFGKLMSIFVGAPLAADKRSYEDVQLIFYPFNAKSAAASNLNIAEFPIRVDDLITGFNAIGVQQGLAIPIKDFIQYIANNFIDDMTSPAYGLGNSYRSTIDDKSGVRRPPQNAKQADDTKLFDAVQARLRKLKVQDGVFKMPQVDVIIETVPLDVTEVGQSARTESNKTVLKIHFFDKCATAYESLGQLILASRENTINALGNATQDAPERSKVDHTAVYNNYLNLAEKAGIITPVRARDARDIKVFDVKYDYERLKTFIRQNMPSIVYGVNNTAVEEAGLSTIQEPRLSTIHMRRAGEQGSLAPAGLTRANLPLRTLPAQITMLTAGCPLVHYMQQFFVDFGTNTTCDNIYGVNKLSHELVPGKFISRMELIPLDAYGRYETLATQVGVAIQKLAQAIDNSKSTKKKSE